MRRPEHRSRGASMILLSVTAVVATLLVPAGAASAASVWSFTPTPSPPSPARAAVAGVTCPSTASCFAVGSYRDHLGHALPLAARWSGTTWSATPAPLPGVSSSEASGSLFGVACASATTCFGVGSYDDGSPTTLIERWNGTAWSVATFGDPPDLESSALTAISCPTVTMCFAVGSAFDGTNFGPLIERWNGSAWSVVASPNPAGGTAGVLNGVACTGASACFAVGSFTSDTTHTGRTLTERWNGNAWSVVASPNAPGVNNSALKAVACPAPTSCFAAGRIESDPTFGTDRTLIERWNGTAWSIVPSPNIIGADDDSLFGISCASPSNCVAVGWYLVDRDTPDTQSLIQHWNGTGWSIKLAPAPGGTKNSKLFGVACASSTLCMAVGAYELPLTWTLIYRWNGANWFAAGSGGSESRLRHVSCASTTNCFAVGDAFNGAVGNTLIEHWDGTTWSVVASANPPGTARRLSGVSCPTATMCMAVGQYVDGSGVTKPFTERWEGGVWSIVASPDPAGSGALLAVTCLSAANCFAVGESAGMTLIERWNGTAWSLPPVPDTGDNSMLAGVTCASATNCFAVGNSTSSESTGTLVERWNGTAWSIVASPNSGDAFNQLADVSCTSATNCFAVGGSQTFFLDAGRTLIEHWNGSAWTVVPSPVLPSLPELSGVACTGATSCTAVGRSQSRSMATIIERWNGESWSIVPSPQRAGAYTSSLESVACRTATNCVAVGSSSTEISTSTMGERFG